MRIYSVRDFECRSAVQRQEIAKIYETNYDKSLVKELQKELSGDFERLVLACMEVSKQCI